MLMKTIHLALLALFAVISPIASAKDSEPLKTESKTITYKDGDVTLEGYAIWPTGMAHKAPGVLVVHDWTGLQDYTKMRAGMLAQLGYAAFCVDIYGEGIRPPGPPASSQEAGKYKNDRALFRQRLALGLEQLKKLPTIDTTRLAAIGYCFGGTGVLELARSGADVSGVVSFHGGLDSPTPDDGKNIKSKVLVLHGADDPFVPKKDIESLVAELNAGKVDWQMVAYSGAVHSFTNKAAGNDNSKGAAYNENADLRSWIAMKNFLSEIFSTPDASK